MSTFSTRTVYAGAAGAAQNVGVSTVYMTLVVLDFLRGLAHAPTRESLHRVVVALLALTVVLIAAALLALALRLPLEAMFGH